MTTKEKAITYCIEKLEQLQLTEIFNQTEFDRCFKGCNQLNPFAVGLNIADKLIYSHHYKLLTHDRTNKS